MAPRWKLTVEGLGKIERAEVEVRRLTLFVGPNNSGKSYLTSLLWGLVAMAGDLEPPQGAAREAADAWLATHIVENEGRSGYQISGADVALFDALFDAALEAKRDELVRRVFNSASVGARRIAFRNLTAERAWRADWATGGQPSDVTGEKQRDALMQLIPLGPLCAEPSAGFVDSFKWGDPVYLPASRTGFMQLYKVAARRSLRAAFRREAERRDFQLELTAPSFHFIDMIAFGLAAEEGESLYEAEANLLEQSLGGRVELVAGMGAVNEYRYHPMGSEAPLPMNLSSALVTELAPLVLLLRHTSGFPVLVLEEPEAHLHPELQRRVAQVIVRLIRKGLFVWITTHSENLCQEINNFIKLGSLPLDKRGAAQQKLGYGPQDYLELDDVSGCEFRLDETGERSSVVEMKRTEAGLVMPSFNRAILKLSKDVAYLDALLDE